MEEYPPKYDTERCRMEKYKPKYDTERCRGFLYHLFDLAYNTQDPSGDLHYDIKLKIKELTEQEVDKYVEEILSSDLGSREKEILLSLHGLRAGSDKQVTFEEVSKKYHLSPGKVVIIQSKATRKLEQSKNLQRVMYKTMKTLDDFVARET